jgi:hypothetical protein
MLTRGLNMPRFTPWHPSAEPDHPDFEIVIRAVLRPSLRLAFPLPGKSGPADETFHKVLTALAAQERGSRAPQPVSPHGTDLD